MGLRDDLVRLLSENSVTDVTKEMSVILGKKAEIAMENGDSIFSDRLQAAADHFWAMEDFGV